MKSKPEGIVNYLRFVDVQDNILIYFILQKP